MEEYQQFYDQLKSFRDNDEINEMPFGMGFTPFQRKLVHQICGKLRLEHESITEGSDRYVLVSKVQAKDWSPSTRGSSFPRGKKQPEYVVCTNGGTSN
jgi:hypothetical protein